MERLINVVETEDNLDKAKADFDQLKDVFAKVPSTLNIKKLKEAQQTLIDAEIKHKDAEKTSNKSLNESSD